MGDGGSVQWGMVVVFSGDGGSVQSVWGMVVVFSGGWW